MRGIDRRTAMTALALAAAAPGAVAQTASPTPRLALSGYDPVAYFVDRKPAAGRPEFELVWDDVRYRFASAEHLAAFRSDPERYAPQFGGLCAMGMSSGATFEADPQAWVIADGKLFVFGNVPSRDEFHADFAERLRKARENWAVSALPRSKPAN